jgi:aryl-alcohol dehydrogenase-like predicted oxidoreductase
MKDMGNRDRVVLATKYTFNQHPSDPNAGGNSRKHMFEALEDSLRRLQTDYVDLYWMHTWDRVTPAEEVMRAFDDLVREGKVRYIALSDVPGWYVGRAQTLAELHGWTPISALQLEYSLVERSIEHEFVPAVQHLGMGILPWSPLASGLLTGKYKRGGQGEGRLKELKDSGNPVFEKLTDRNFDIVDALLKVAEDLGKSPAQVALNWATKRPGVVSTIIGATKLEQLEDNLAALSFDLPEGQRQRLEEASDPDRPHPYVFHHEPLQDMVHGERTIKHEAPWYRG